MKFITDYRLEHFILDTRWETLPEPVQERLAAAARPARK